MCCQVTHGSNPRSHQDNQHPSRITEVADSTAQRSQFKGQSSNSKPEVDDGNGQKFSIQGWFPRMQSCEKIKNRKTQCSKTILYKIFINNQDSFSTPIGGERVTWGCLTVDNDQLELFITASAGRARVPKIIMQNAIHSYQ